MPASAPGWASRLLDLWGELPTTQARITVTLGVFVATAYHYLTSQASVLMVGPTAQLVPRWEPTREWLLFIAVMAGLDAAQYFGKRKTDATYAAVQKGVKPTPPPTDPKTTQ